MSSKNDLSVRLSKNLIVISVNGVETELWGLCKPTTDRRLRHMMDQDEFVDRLVNQVKSEDPAKAKEAIDGLIWLNAYNQAEYSRNFAPLEKLNVKISKDYKLNTYSRNNSAQRDFTNNNQDTQIELNNFISSDNTTLGEMVDYNRSVRKKTMKLACAKRGKK